MVRSPLARTKPRAIFDGVNYIKKLENALDNLDSELRAKDYRSDEDDDDENVLDGVIHAVSNMRASMSNDGPAQRMLEALTNSRQSLSMNRQSLSMKQDEKRFGGLSVVIPDSGSMSPSKATKTQTRTGKSKRTLPSPPPTVTTAKGFVSSSLSRRRKSTYFPDGTESPSPPKVPKKKNIADVKSRMAARIKGVVGMQDELVRQAMRIAPKQDRHKRISELEEEDMQAVKEERSEKLFSLRCASYENLPGSKLPEVERKKRPKVHVLSGSSFVVDPSVKLEDIFTKPNVTNTDMVAPDMVGSLDTESEVFAVLVSRGRKRLEALLSTHSRGNKYINLQQFRTVMEEQGISDAQVADSIFEVFSGGMKDRAEWSKILDRIMDHVNGSPQLRMLFDVFDMDRDGILSKLDLYKVATATWPDANPQRKKIATHMVQMAFNKLPIEKNGTMDFEGFKSAVEGTTILTQVIERVVTGEIFPF